MKLPAEFVDPQARTAAAVPTAPATGSGNASDGAKGPHRFRDLWYGFYPNGREILFGRQAVPRLPVAVRDPLAQPLGELGRQRAGVA